MFRGILKNRSGNTGPVANTWVQVAAENPSRVYIYFQNISDTAITLGVGSPSAEFEIAEIKPGDNYSGAGFVTTQRIVAKSSGVSKQFFASEA